MSIAYALVFLCDAALYYGIVGCLGMLSRCSGRLFLAPLALTAACWLSGKLTGRGKPWHRWAPLALGLACPFLAGSLAGALVSLPMMAYLPLYVYNNSRPPDYDYTADRFRHCLIGMGVALIPSLLFRAASWTKGLPWLFVFFTLSVTLLRLLRHDDRVARSRRFRVLNLTGVTLVCAAGFGLSQPGVVAVVKAAWLWFADNVLLNLAAAVLFVLECAFWLLGRLLLLIPGFGDGPLGQIPQLAPGQETPPTLQSAEEVRALPPFVRFAIQAMLIALLAVIVFVVLRALAQRVARADVSVSQDTRESLDDVKPPRAARRASRRDGPEGVRRYYRKALALLRARGGKVAPNMNTLQIHDANATDFDAEALSDLRSAYLPVRYGGQTPTPEALQSAKAAYDRLKAAGRRA